MAKYRARKRFHSARERDIISTLLSTKGGFTMQIDERVMDSQEHLRQGVQGVDVDCRGYKSQTDFWANSAINVPYLNKGVRALDAWTPANPNSDIPALTTSDTNNEGRVSSYFIEDGSYVKLRTVQIGYNLPQSVNEKLHVDRIRFYASAQNLLTIKSNKFTGADPENPGFNYPIPLNLTFGLNVSF